MARTRSVDSEHTRTDGYTSSSVLKIADGPYVTGYSQRYNDNLSWGRTAWLYDGSTTQVIGLVDADHTRSDGYRESTTFAALNSLGYVAGTSRRYVSPSTTGESVWIHDGVETKNVGLTDIEHSRSDGYQHSFITNLNANGHVAGHSYRFEDMNANGRSAWIYDGIETHVVGLRDLGYTSPDDFQDSIVKDLNIRGEAVGTSTRFGGGIGLGTSAWFFDGENSTEIGLVDDEHTKSDGVRIASINGLSEVGRAFGNSQRYEGTISRGYSTWVYDGQSTTKIGLIDSPHTATNGYRESSVYLFSDSGNAIGHSRRFNGSGDFFGSSAWLYNGSETILLAPSGPEYLRNDDYRVTTASRLTNSGFVGGTAVRVGEGYSGEDAWVFNPNTQQMTSIVLSTRSDGYSRSHVQYLSEDGVALGTYALYDENDALIGDRIFYFAPDEGAFDLESLVRGGLSAAGWEYLQGHQRTSVVIANDAGLITGAGRRLPLGTDRTAYLLVPLSGDFDVDGDVDGRDFLAWQRGESPEPFSAEDLALWQAEYGKGDSLRANVAVPEPSVAMLSVLGMLVAALVKQGRPAIR